MKKLALFITLMTASIAFAEPYEAVLFPERSLRYENTFGTFYDDFDILVIPLELAERNGRYLAGSFTNVEKGGVLSLGSAFSTGAGNFSLYLRAGGLKKSGVQSNSYLQYLDENGDGTFEFLNAVTDRVATGEEQTGYLVGVGTGYGRRWGNLLLGGGVQFNFEKHRNPYNGMSFLPAVCLPGSYFNENGLCGSDFAPGSIDFKGRESVLVDVTNEDVVRIFEEDFSNSEEMKLWALDFIGGVKYPAGAHFRFSTALLAGVEGERNAAKTRYSFSDYARSASTYTGLYTENSNTDDLYFKGGIKVRTEILPGESFHTFIIDIGYQGKFALSSEGDLKGSFTEMSTSPFALYTHSYDANSSAGKVKKFESDTWVFLRDIYYLRYRYKIAWGLDLYWQFNAERVTRKTVISGEGRFNDLDSEKYDPDDLTFVEGASLERFSRTRKGKLTVLLPLVFIAKLGATGELRIGGAGVITKEWNKDETELTDFSPWMRDITYGNGNKEVSFKGAPHGVPLLGERESVAQNVRNESVQTYIILRAGCGFLIKNSWNLSFMVEGKTSPEAPSASALLDLKEVRASLVLRF